MNYPDNVKKLHPLQVSCQQQCLPGELVCQCITGLFRDNYGKCVTRAQCRGQTVPACPVNEDYFACGTRCEPTCRDPNPVSCQHYCVQGELICQCKVGFYRADNGTCVSDCRPGE
ncbi:trypsin Inhibitor like cysteine rich domain protein [Oesophagostomum dentatum]|uniref:Trypsin Inhibitor like cysteine rich domain protein n=1 Tax=Oesophagostomum dentatum TaxID=61180 RepID=A0A0B1S968_OESDE|nr:trypsin Inhibitor like cysteine rich domain protein [Oesophagostomum dentatum]